MRETRMLEVVPWKSCTLIWKAPPYVQSVFVMVKVGWRKPCVR